MGPSTIDELRARWPDERVLTSEDERRQRSRDWWPLARLLEGRGDPVPMPDAVLMPQDTEEVSAMLAWASASGTVVVPRGGGSGVCGAVVPPTGSIVLDVSAIDRISDIDERSRIVRVGAGIRGDRLEAALAEGGLTMGHLPQSLALSSPGGWVAAWSAGQASPAYGAIEDRLVGLTAVLVDGTVVRVEPMPRAVAGIDLRRIFLGSEGTLGVVTEVVLALSPQVARTSWFAAAMPDFAACLEAARLIRHADIHPRFIRGWDEPDAERAFGAQHAHEGAAVVLVGLASDAPGGTQRLEASADIARSLGGRAVDAGYGETWWSHRLAAVERFDAVMGPERVEGDGVVLDTLEVTARWAELPEVHAAVSSAFRVATPELGCHFSHVYGTGAALYFTFLLRADDDSAAVELYEHTWDRALSAALASGATIAHHHGIGRLKAGHLASALDPGATDLLVRIKRALDPDDLLNPGAGLAALLDTQSA